MGLAVSQERPIRDDLVVRASIVSQPGATKGHRLLDQSLVGGGMENDNICVFVRGHLDKLRVCQSGGDNE